MVLSLVAANTAMGRMENQIGSTRSSKLNVALQQNAHVATFDMMKRNWPCKYVGRSTGHGGGRIENG